MLLHLQGLRGIAIFSVLLFHLFPKWFPNGFLGVDIFFVLSGYLMAWIFSKESEISMRCIIDFYYKRIKRIFPLYFLILAVILISSQLLLNSAWISLNNSHAFYSMMFLKNMETIWAEGDYFSSFTLGAPNKDLYLHTWSLAVEIQFYLIVPFIFWILSFFSSRHYKAIVLTIFSAFSFILYYTGHPNFSFNCPISRVWQFATGMIVFLIRAEEDERQKISLPLKGKEEEGEKEGCHLKDLLMAAFPVRQHFNMKLEQAIVKYLTPATITFLLAPFVIPDVFSRPVATILAGLLVYFGGRGTHLILEHKTLTCLGDLSYTIYLVHWPVIVLFWKNSISSFLITSVVIVTCTLLLYNFYETNYRTLGFSPVFMLMAGLISLNVLLYISFCHIPAVVTFFREHNFNKLSPELRKIVDKNIEFSNTVYYRRGNCTYNATASAGHPAFAEPWGVYDFPNGNGSAKVLVIGNSYARMQASLIHEEFRGNYSSFRVVAGLRMSVLYEFPTKRDPVVAGKHEAAMKIVEEYRPDYIFIATRLEWPIKAKILQENIENDGMVKECNEKIRQLENMTSARIFIQGANPYYPRLHLQHFIEALSEGGDLLQFHKDKTEAELEMSNGKRRLQAIKCRRCEIYDTGKTYLDYDHERYLGFEPDTLLSLMDNSIHLTDAGLERWRPVFTELINKL